MLNHFASLLANFRLQDMQITTLHSSLGTGTGQEVVLGNGLSLDLTNSMGVGLVTQYSQFTDRNYTNIVLPIELERIYNILFPPTASFYYKQFLLFCYLRTIAATDMSSKISIYDSRISYDLDEVGDYFKFGKISAPYNSNPLFNILASGRSVSNEAANNFTNKYTVIQPQNSLSVLVRSDTQRLYYKPGVAPSMQPAGMATQLTGSQYASDTIAIGDTGISFSIAGPLSAFTQTSDKYWTFYVDAAPQFNLLDRVKFLDVHYTTVDEMLNYARAASDNSNENLWRMHYNPVYRLAGLLLAYVERVNFVWVNRAT
jgi:hypothetical protein